MFPVAFTAPLHPAQRRYLAEDIVRRRRSDEQRRYAAPQRAARIDANPHQINAVVFALGRLREGGCILADEVGLGKTIEAGLVIAQLLAEGARRILLVAPKPLLGQWRQELYQLFDIEAREGSARKGGFEGPGVFLIGREAAGSENGELALLAAERFDLCVVDEAHEVFAGIYKRFDTYGEYQPESPHARTAGRLRRVLHESRVPVLLLTATPIQNSLLELWGLVQYVDPLGTLLGDLPTFREVFCPADPSQIATGQEQELRGRLRHILQRTLRREAQEFLEKPFVDRHARLFEYAMAPEEKALYDDITRYLLEPGIVAFAGNQRQLLLLTFHRRMASSLRALGDSLRRVALRLRRLLSPQAETMRADAEDVEGLQADFDGEELAPPDEEDTSPSSPHPAPAAADSARVRTELQRVEAFIQRAERLTLDSKFQALLKALEFVMARARAGSGAGKLVIFTESLATQDYLRDRLIESRLVTDDEITLFRGRNDTERARRALARWREERSGSDDDPSAEIATRLALVHEFATRSRVFIATEAGAKGLNLQFCDTLVNYDLPWNPQRIEQRIGRCHRYGQRHDVTVVNFLARDNEAQALTFEILSQKLELFGTVLDASDHVLHPAEGSGRDLVATTLGSDIEAELRRIYDRARSLDEVSAELRALRDKVAESRRRYEETRARTASVIEQRFDEGVRRRFRHYQERVPRALADLDRDLRALVISYLDALGVGHAYERSGNVELLCVAAHAALPPELRGGIQVAVGDSKEHVSLHPGHPLVLAAVADARAAGWAGAVQVELPGDAAAGLARHSGQRGRLRVVKVTFDGFEPMDLLLPVIALESGDVLPPELAEAVLTQPLRPAGEVLHAGVGPAAPWARDDVLADAIEEALFALQADLDAGEGQRFSEALLQAERFLGDRRFVLERRLLECQTRLDHARERRDGASGAEARTGAERAVAAAQQKVEALEGAIERLDRRDDARLREFEAHIHARRGAPPRIESLFDLDLVIA